MIYKNSFKILFANYGKSWKNFAYILLSTLIIAGLAVAVSFPIYQKLLSEGVFTALSDTYVDFINSLNLQEFLAGMGQWFTRFTQVVADNFASLWVYFALFVVVLFVFGSVVVGASGFAYCGTINYFMNSGASVPYTTMLVSSSAKNLSYRLTNVLVLTPINLGIFALTVYAMNAINSLGLSVLAPFVAVFTFILLSALKTAIFGSWMPAMIVKNTGTFRGLVENFRVLPRRFGYVLFSAFAMGVTLVFVNIFGGLCTFGVGLIITVPLTLALLSTFNLTAFYTRIGQRYYYDYKSVCAPKRQEYTDNFARYKYII